MFRHDIKLTHGVGYHQDFEYTDPAGNPFGWAGWSARLQVRDQPTSLSPVLTLTEAQGISLAFDGFLSIAISPSQSAMLGEDKTYLYNLLLTSGQQTVEFCRGFLTVRPSATV